MDILTLALPTQMLALKELAVPPVTEDADTIDIRASLNGDSQAFARIVRRYQHLVFHQMWRFTRDQVELDDLVQEVFVEVYKSLKRYKGQAPLLHWIRKIASRVGFHFWKRKKRTKEIQDAMLGLPHIPWSSPENHSPSEAADILYKLFARLNIKDRLILTLHYFDGCDAQEIAERMDWSPNRVRVRQHRALKKLKEMIEQMNCFAQETCTESAG